MTDEDDVRKLSEFLSNINKKNDNLKFENLIISDEEEEEEESLTNISIDEITENFDINIDVTKINHQLPSGALILNEEKVIIDNCVDPQLKNLLFLNRQKNIQLILYYKKIKDLLFECKANICDKTEEIQKNEMNANKKFNGKLWRVAAPYFKDKDNFAAPPNNDTITKKHNKELSVYDIYASNKWSLIECEKLVKSVKLNYSLNMHNELLKKLRSYETENLKEADLLKIINDTAKLGGDEEILKVKEMYEDIKQNFDLCPPLNSDHCIDWFRISSLLLNDNHTPNECKAFWHIHLHPEINKDNWTQEENLQIIKLVKTYKCQDWDKIAIELNTKRSGFSVCHHYMSKLQTKFKKDKFTQKEDTKLLKLVDKYRVGKTIEWSKIRHHFADRKREQLYHRYTYFLNKNVKKTRFEVEEDVLLLLLVDKFGRQFTKIAEIFPERSASQLKARYNGNLQGRIRRGSFTKEDDMIIMDYVKIHGDKRWGGLVNTVHRSRAQIRQRYLVLKKYFQDDPDGSFDDITRRNHRHWVDETSAYEQAKAFVDQFKGKPIPTLAEIKSVMPQEAPKKSSKIVKNKKSPVMAKIDEQLIDFFSKAQKPKFQFAPKTYYSPAIEELKNNVKSMLDILGAKLEIPADLKHEKNLDALDVQVLDQLREYCDDKSDIKTDKNSGITQLLPPDLHSVMGMTSLLLKYKSYQLMGDNNFDVIEPEREFMESLKKMPSQVREQVISERNLFLNRFTTLFKWPAILSFIEPSPNLVENNEQPIQGEKRKMYTNPEVSNKLLKLEIQPIMLDTKNSVRIPLEKMQQFSDSCSQKNVKLIIINNNVKRNVNNKITEIPSEEPSCSYSNEEKTPEIENIDNELQDLQKLQAFLKKENIKIEEPDDDT